jgi:glycosyltransferase involved in cell wall biosynthesis
VRTITLDGWVIKIKITMIGALPPLTWNSTYSLELSRSLAQYVDLVFISFKKLYPTFLYPSGKVKGKNISILDENEKFKIERSIVYYNPFTWILAGLSAKGDIIHIQWGIPIFSPVFFAILLISKLRKKKIIATAHNVLPHEHSKMDKILTKLVFYLVDVFIVHSTKNIGEMHDTLGIPKEKIIRIPHGILKSFKDGMVTQKDAREKLKLPLDGKIILFFGNIREYKGLDAMLEAFSYVIKEMENVLLVIAGSTWVKWEKYEELIEKNNLNKNIKLFLEFIPSDKAKYFYYASDLVVLPYREFMSQSGAGAVALAFEKPLIVTDVGGLPELVKDKNFVVEPNNPRELAEKILLVLSDDELLKKLSEDSRDLAEEYSWDKIAEKTVGLYRCVIRGEQI